MTPADRQAGNPTLRPGPELPSPGRWRLERALPVTMFGEVWKAWDNVGRREVALKFLKFLTSEQRERFRREAQALRSLRVEGVARYVDHGEDEGRPYIATEWVDGHPFPNGETEARMDWDVLAPLARQLLDTVGRIHTAGLIHRDLKPANVLVGDDGRVTVLDFGLVRGPALGTTITREGQVAGTPRYISPEQARGEREVDERADLFAIGVMLYEALTGKHVQNAKTARLMLDLRAHTPVPPIGTIAPTLPPLVAGGIDRLLMFRVADRPTSAGEALRMLGLTIGPCDLPVVGFDGLVAEIAADLMAHRSVDVWGPEGSGRSTVLRLVSARLRAEGVPVFTVEPGARAFDSLRPLHPTESGTTLPEQLGATIDSLLAAGMVFVCDASPGPDRWTAALLEARRSQGAILRVAVGGRPLPRPTARDLRALFVGPDRLFHLAEDAAAELWRRTGGLPRNLMRELEAWVASGLAEPAPGGRVRIGRRALDRLGAGLRVDPPGPFDWGLGGVRADLHDLAAWIGLGWPHARAKDLCAWMSAADWQLGLMLEALEREGQARFDKADGWRLTVPTGPVLSGWSREQRVAAHRRIAETIPGPSEGRFGHLLDAGAPQEAAAEAIALAGPLVRAGHATRAFGVLEAALGALDTAQSPLRDEVLLALLRVPYANESVSSFEAATTILLAETDPSPLVDRGRRLGRLTLEAFSNVRPELLDEVHELGVMGDEHLERWRQDLRFFITRNCAAPELPALLKEMIGWAGEAAGRQCTVSGLQGLAAYSANRFEEAAAFRLRAAELAPGLRERLHYEVGAAAAFIEAGWLPEARALAQKVLVESAEARLPSIEARATWILRLACYQAGEQLAPDLELQAAVREHPMGPVDGQLLLQEAAVEFRCGNLPSAAALAEDARRRWAQFAFRPGADLAEALAWACEGSRRPVDPDALLDRAESPPFPAVAIQVVGLVARASPPHRARCLQMAERLAAGLPAGTLTRRRDILAPAEVLVYCRETPEPPSP